MLLLVQLLQVHQRIFVFRIQAQHLVERLERTIDEAAALVVESEAEEHVGVNSTRVSRERCSSD